MAEARGEVRSAPPTHNAAPPSAPAAPHLLTLHNAHADRHSQADTQTGRHTDTQTRRHLSMAEELDD